MELYFLRHGPAGSMSWHGDDDSQRPLTAEGRDVVARVADGLAGMKLDVDRIVSSPYVRAAETAELIAKRLGVSDSLRADDRLAAGMDLPELREVLRDHGDGRSLMLVGHEPDFSTLVGELTGGSRVRLKKAGIARVDVDGPDASDGVLVWLIPPSAFKR